MPIPWLADIFKGISVEGGGGWKKRVAEFFLRGKYEGICKLILPFIKGEVLDVGVGDGSIAMFLIKKGHGVRGVDVVNHSLYREIQPLIYNGRDMPFKDKTFGTAIIISVLHHCSDGLRVLEEAKRVAKRVIVVEDTYRSGLERALVANRDAWCNFEFYGHCYRKVDDWKRIIRERGWKLTAVEEWSSVVYGFYGRQCLMVID